MEKCSPGYSFGPDIRDHYIIHYIYKGKGIFKYQDKHFELEKGHGFLIYPGESTFYKADYDDPWCYYWIGFSGIKADYYLKRANLTAKKPIFKYPNILLFKELFDDMLCVGKSQNQNVKELYFVGFLNIFISRLIELGDEISYSQDMGLEQDIKWTYVEKAIRYIERNYCNKIYISHIADYLGLNASYFGMIFRQYTGVSPQEFLIRYRMDKACLIMESSPYDIKHVSYLVGYDDPLLFTKMFKKYKGVTPSRYKKEDGEPEIKQGRAT